MSEKSPDPVVLRQEVERTRKELVDTVSQLHGKVDQARRLPVGLMVAGGVGVLVVVILLLRRR